MTTTIKTEIANLPSDILPYKGKYFHLSRTIDGSHVEMSEEEMRLYVARIKAVIDEALLNSTIDIDNVGAFAFNSDNRTFYIFNNKNDLSDGSPASQTVKIKQAVVDSFSGEKIEKTATDKAGNSNSSNHSSFNPVSSADPADYSFEDQKNNIVENLRNPKSQIQAPSLAAYNQILENKYNTNGNQIRVLDPVIIQNNDFGSNQSISNLINLFNREGSLDTVYAPIHVGSSPGHREGHWIAVALTRKLGNTVIAVYDSLGGKEMYKSLANYIEQYIGPSRKIISGENVQHQDNSIDCGVHVLNFINNMEETEFANIEYFLTDQTRKINTSGLRKTFADELEKSETTSSFSKGGRHDLRTVKDYHITLDDSKSIGAYELKKIHTAQLAEFKKDTNAIRSQHFDWWTFPIKAASDTYKNLYAIDDMAIQQLMYDDEFMTNYLESAQLVLAAYGWELKNHNNIYVIKPYENRRHEIPEIRLAKMAESFYLFDRNLYNALVQLSKDQPIVGETIKDNRTKKAFNLNSWYNYFNPFS